MRLRTRLLVQTAGTERVPVGIPAWAQDPRPGGVEGVAVQTERSPSRCSGSRSVRLAAVVVEGRYSALFKLEHVSGAWLADQLSRLEVRYPEVRVVFADSRRFAEDWTHRFLSSAFADAEGSSEQ